MKKTQYDELTTLFSQQLQIINDNIVHLHCDLYVCFEGEEEIKKLQKKILKLRNMKMQLIQMYSTLIGEF
jgi:hypothetical protein